MSYQLGIFARARLYFEADAEFAETPFVKAALTAYDKAARSANRLSRNALTDSQWRDPAIWAESQAQTLEAVLCMCLATDARQEIELKTWQDA